MTNLTNEEFDITADTYLSQIKQELGLALDDDNLLLTTIKLVLAKEHNLKGWDKLTIIGKYLQEEQKLS